MVKNKTKILILFIILAFAVLIAAGSFLTGKLIRRITLAEYPIKYEQYVDRYAQEFEVDPYLVYAVIRTESGFKPNATSNVQARGLMQITEETFAWIKLKNAPFEDITFDDMYDEETNIRFGTYFLSRCLQRYGDEATAIAAYHSGWGTVDDLLLNPDYAQNSDTLRVFPYEQMSNYVYKVTQNYEKYLKIYTQQ